MSLSLGYVSGGGGGAGVAPTGGQYMAMVPPQQPPTPTSHAPPPQLFTTFFRPSVQVGDSTSRMLMLLEVVLWSVAIVVDHMA